MRPGGSPWSPTRTVTLGPVDRVLGLLALTQGDVDAAVADLRAAVALAASRRPLWLARSEIALATALRARAAPGDAAEVVRLFDRVRLSPTADPTRGSAWLAAQVERGTLM